MFVGAALDAVSIANEGYTSYQTGNWTSTEQEVTRVAGGWAGATELGAAGAEAGLEAGAFIGSIVPGAGTAVGAVVGGAVGGAVGYFGGSRFATTVWNAFHPSR